MKVHHFISFVFLLSTFGLSAQTTKTKSYKQAQPSRDETIKWINNKMADKPSSPINENGTVNRVKESISSDGKTYYQDFIIYKSFTEAFSKSPQLYNRNITSVSLSDLNPNSLRIRYYKDVFFVSVSTTNSLRKIKVQVPSSYANEPVSEYDTHNNSTLDFGPFSINNESNLEQRMIKALKYLITLNGGKSEAF